MEKKRRNSGMWENDFEDISSHSQNDPNRRPRPVPESRAPRPAENRPSSRNSRPPRRPDPDWEVPEWELSDRNRRPRAGPDRPGGRTSPASQRRGGRPGPRPAPPPRKRTKKPLSAGARKAVMAFTVLVMAAATALLAIFLLFKVSDIQITGDVIEGYQNADILEICGYEIGDNLFFLSTKDKEKKLMEQLPYIGEAKISRHLPGTLEIHLTAAEIAACVSGGSSWFYVSGEGKILEKQDEPKSGALQIMGLAPLDAEPGQMVRVEDDNAQTAYRTILAALTELGTAGDFTRLDLSDLSDIRLIYQDRIEFLLGNVLELQYKVELGCRSVAELGAGETGVMDLAYADETKRAIFTAGAIDAAASQAPAEPQQAVSPSPSPSSSPRTDGIPDDVYTGGDTGGDTGDTGGTDGGDDPADDWGGGDTGDTDNWDEPEDTWDTEDGGTGDTGDGDTWDDPNGETNYE